MSDGEHDDAHREIRQLETDIGRIAEPENQTDQQAGHADDLERSTDDVADDGDLCPLLYFGDSPSEGFDILDLRSFSETFPSWQKSHFPDPLHAGQVFFPLQLGHSGVRP